MTLKELKLKYIHDTITKPRYIKEMHRVHDVMFEYAKFINDTDIKSIEILDDCVIMTSRSTNIKMICDPKDERIAPIEILNFGHYEKTDFDMTIQLMNDIITDKTVIFDIGANVGWYTINLSKLYPHSTVFSFEPLPRTYSQLLKNIELNNIQNAILCNLGLSNSNTQIEFYYYPEHSGNASMTNVSNSVEAETVVCDVKKLDDYFNAKKLQNLDFIKCDVEGAELFVFQGGLKTIEQTKPIILTELLRKWSAKFNYNPNELIVLLQNMGYICFTAKNNKLVEFFAMTETTLENTFFFLHSVKHKDLIIKYI